MVLSELTLTLQQQYCLHLERTADVEYSNTGERTAHACMHVRCACSVVLNLFSPCVRERLPEGQARRSTHRIAAEARGRTRHRQSHPRVAGERGSVRSATLRPFRLWQYQPKPDSMWALLPSMCCQIRTITGIPRFSSVPLYRKTPAYEYWMTRGCM